MEKLKKKLLLKSLKFNLLSLYRGLKKWIFVPGRSILLVIAIIIAAIIALTVVVGITLGCLGTVIVGAASIPALLLMFAFNLVVPACGGPAITFKMSVGLVILAVILMAFLHAVRK